MVQYFLRIIAFLTLCILFITIGVKATSPHIPDKIGVVQADGSDGFQTYGIVYDDLDTGITYEIIEGTTADNYPIPFVRALGTIYDDSIPPVPYYFINEADQVELRRSDANGEMTLAVYDQLYAIDSYWNATQDTLYVIDNATVTDTTVHAISVADGTSTPIVTLLNFAAGFSVQSPDYRYLLLRAIGFEAQAVSNRMAREMLLLDLHTATIISLDEPDVAYWSPDSKKLAIGHIADDTLMLDMSIYDVETGNTRALDIQASYVDLPFFQSFRTYGIAWTADSQGLALLNQYDDQLHYAQLDGEPITIEADNLRPRAWSTIGERLIATGYYQSREIGVYIVDFETGKVTLLDIGDAYEANQTRYTWSANGKYAVISRSNWITLYALDGEQVLNRYPIGDALDLMPLTDSIEWLSRR